MFCPKCKSNHVTREKGYSGNKSYVEIYFYLHCAICGWVKHMFPPRDYKKLSVEQKTHVGIALGTRAITGF